MVKQVKWESIIALPVQNPKQKLIFSRSDLDWSLVQGKHMDSLDQIAKIPSTRIGDFIKGEGMNPNMFFHPGTKQTPRLKAYCLLAI